MSPAEPTRPSRRAFLRGSAAAAAGLWLAPSASAQIPPSQHRAVEPVRLPLDQPGVWTLNFAYTPVRILPVDTPDRGRRIVWYMVYQVWNKSDLPQRFVPEFLLVTKDGDVPRSYPDWPEPWIAKKVRAIEDPTGRLDIQTSISISKNKIPVTKVDSYPRVVHGVAIWPDVATESAQLNRFSVYVSGLSNGISQAETDDGRVIISKKTLQIDFVRPTDARRSNLSDIRPNDNSGLGSEKWIYRETPRPIEPKKAEEPEKKG